MSLEAAIYDILKSAGGVTSLVGGRVSPRIYPLGLPQGKPVPAVAWQIVSNPEDVTCAGNTGSRDARVQITAWDDDPDGARVLIDAIYAALSAAGARGSHGGSTIAWCTYLDERDVYDPGVENETLARYGKAQDWEISHIP